MVWAGALRPYVRWVENPTPFDVILNGKDWEVYGVVENHDGTPYGVMLRSKLLPAEEIDL